MGKVDTQSKDQQRRLSKLVWTKICKHGDFLHLLLVPQCHLAPVPIQSLEVDQSKQGLSWFGWSMRLSSQKSLDYELKRRPKAKLAFTIFTFGGQIDSTA
jgi:hypothetical protein